MQGLGSVGNRANYELSGLELFLKGNQCPVVEQRIFFLGFLCCERGTEHGGFCDLLVLLSTSTAWD